ncbi:hypothetical protein B0H17DRAFT_1264538, partial [Mycena rosella]
MAESDFYAHLLYPRGHGCALYHPQPFDDLPRAVRKIGTRIGNVGVIMNGGFDPIFNILDSAADNPAGFPQGFEPARLRDGAIAEQRFCHPPGSDVSNTTIDKRRLGVDVSTNSKETAILLLPDGASRWDLRQLQVFRDYALKNAQSWYEFVNGELGRMIGNGDLYLVTGVTKSSSWGVAAIENQSGDGRVSLRLIAAQIANAEASYAWQWETTSSSLNSGPLHRREGEESWRDNQTVFIRGFKIRMRSKLPLKVARKPKLVWVTGSKPKSVPFSLSRLGPWPTSSGNTAPQTQPSTSATSGAPQKSLEANDLPPISSDIDSSSDDSEASLDRASNLYHPSDIINEYLLQCVPEAMVAVTHDDEWASVFNEADDRLPEPDELISRISNKFKIDSTAEGVCFLAVKVQNTPDQVPPSPGDSGLSGIDYSDHQDTLKGDSGLHTEPKLDSPRPQSTESGRKSQRSTTSEYIPRRGAPQNSAPTSGTGLLFSAPLMQSTSYVTQLNNYFQGHKESHPLSWSESSTGVSREIKWTVQCKVSGEVKGTGVAD